MDFEGLEEKKYSELLKLAGKLKLELPQSKKKDVLIHAIKEYHETHCGDENEEPDVVKKKVKKVKKSTKKAKKTDDDEVDSEIDPKNQTMTRARTQAYANQTLNKTDQFNEADSEQQPAEQKKTKKTKKSAKKENEEPEVIETRYEIREDGKKVKIKRVKKKVIKDSKNEEKDEKKTKKVKKTKKKLDLEIENKSETKEANIQCKPEDSDKIVNMSDEHLEEVNNFKLELNESNEISQDNEPICQDTNSIEVSADRSQQEASNHSIEEEKNQTIKNEENNEVIDSSLITNDEEKPENELESENLNVTRDIINTTFDKKDEALPCSSIDAKNDEILVLDTPQCVEQANICHEEPKLVESKQQTEQETKCDEANKPRTGGARIVRPKQTVTVVQTLKTAKNETVVEEVKKVVEVVNREAGPRIVKPTIITDDNSFDPKRKNINDTNNKTKKIKDSETKKKEAESFKVVARKAPDFKAIHEKESQKMESIDSYANRKQERLNKLTEKNSPIVSEEKPKSESRLRTLSAKPQNLFTKKTPLKTATTPKFVKNLASQTGSLLSNIPKMIKREENKKDDNAKLDHKVAEPKTPEMSDQEKKSKLAKTPSSVAKPTESSLLKSNIKRAPSVKLNLNDPNGLASIPPQLQSSSFVRRKSFDLNKSLARPLNYNPHHGRLKKVDFSTKSIFLASLATNLNETKCVDQSVLKPNDSILNASDLNKRRVSTINKLRSDNSGACPDRKMLTDYLKSDKLKQITDKSTQMAKKHRLEKAKMLKQAKSDENRQLNMDTCEIEQQI